MTDERDDVLKDLRAELSAVSPSPGFAASVRTRVAASEKRRGLGVWMWPLGLAGAAGLVLAAFLALGRDEAIDIPTRRDVVAHSSGPSTVAPAMPAPTEPQRSRPGPQVRVTTIASPSPDPQARTPEQVAHQTVITNQGDMIRAVWAHVNRRAVEVAPEVVERPDNAREISLAPIVLEPILVPVLEPGAPGGGGIPVIRRVAVDATRSER